MLGWLLMAWTACLTLFDLRRTVCGRYGIPSTELLVTLAIVLVTAPALWRQRHRITRPGRVMLASFLVLGLWSMASVALTPSPTIHGVLVPRRYRLVPALQGVLTALAAWGVACAIPSWRRRPALWWAALAMVACTPPAWWRVLNNSGTHRLSSALGGAAVVHVALFLCAAIFVAAALDGYRRRTSWVLAVVSIALALASGSRAGLIDLALVSLVGVLWLVPRHLVRRAVLWLLGGSLALVAVISIFPSTRRMLSFSDPLRVMNMETALQAWTASTHSLLLGVGSGRLWPWMAFEGGLVPIPYRGIGATEFGVALTNPHSIFLSMLVELGPFAMIPLLVMFASPVLSLFRHPPRQRSVLVVQLALVCLLPSFFLDYYLFKNHAVSFWWWLVVAAGLGLQAPRGESDPSRPAAAQDPGATGVSS